jgi:hypothetical protein
LTKHKRSFRRVKYDQLSCRTKDFLSIHGNSVNTESIQMNTKIRSQHPRSWLIAALAALFLTACGGGGGDDGTTAGTGGGGTTAGGTTGGDTTGGGNTGEQPPPAPVALAVASTSLTETTNVALNTAPRVTFNVRVNPASIVSLNPTAFILRDMTNGNDVGGAVELDDAGTTATFVPRVNLIPGASYALTVTTAVTSADGTSLAENQTWNFTAAAPGVESTYPRADATGVAINSKVAAVFNTVVDPATSFTLREAAAGGAAVPGTVAYNSDSTRIASFTPTANLQPNTAYTATITSAEAGVTSWTFTTGAQTDSVRPTATFSPADSAENVGVNSVIKVTFSEAIDPSTLDGGRFFVSSVDAWLSGNIVFDPATNTATFIPSEPMLPNTPYHVVVTSGVRDLAGNQLETGSNVELRSDFRTGAL